MTSFPRHIPVMLNEVLKYLEPKDGETYVDATFGNGGYTEAILNSAKCNVIAIDRDPSVLARVKEIKEKYGDRFEFVSGTFGEIAELINTKVNGVVFDIGVSSMQLDDGFRGFSFSKEAELDMRMSMDGISAKDIVNNMPEEKLADLIYMYGEEKKSRQIARKISEARKTKEIKTTTELAEIIYRVNPKKFGQIDPATRTFQALRIAVNDELSQLEKGLANASDIVLENGRVVVVTFHSLEDKIAKKFFSDNSSKRTHVSKYKETIDTESDEIFSFSSKAIIPTQDECENNPRARSAKLRYAIKRKGK